MGIKKYGPYTPSRRNMTGFLRNYKEDSREISSCF